MDNMDNYEERAEVIQTLAQLAEGCDCELSHGPYVKQPAISAIMVRMEDKAGVDAPSTFIIPVCQLCLDDLCNEESPWILLFCLNCCNNSWLDRRTTKLKITGNPRRIFTGGCKKCKPCEKVFVRDL